MVLALVNKLSSVKNAIGFLSGDFDNVLKDIDHGQITDKAQAELFLNATLTEVKLLT